MTDDERIAAEEARLMADLEREEQEELIDDAVDRLSDEHGRIPARMTPKEVLACIGAVEQAISAAPSRRHGRLKRAHAKLLLYYEKVAGKPRGSELPSNRRKRIKL